MGRVTSDVSMSLDGIEAALELARARNGMSQMLAAMRSLQRSWTCNRPGVPTLPLTVLEASRRG
jgi:hypothetical protein